MKKLLLILLFLTSNVFAKEEAQALCDLYNAKAELTSSLISSPYVYGSNNENNTTTIALGYSLAGRSKGILAKEIAEAKCLSATSISELDNIQRWVLVSIHKFGAKAELVSLLKARDLAKEYIVLVEKQLKAQVSTLNDYNSANQILLAIENRINVLKTTLAEPSLPIDTSNIKELLVRARESEGKIAELSAKQESLNAWDVVIATGAQKNLLESDSNISPFIGLSFKWSFGNYGVKESISDIKKKTEIAFSASQSGYVKTADRLFAKVNELLIAEQEREILILSVIADLDRLINTFKDINTALAISTRASFDLQKLIHISELSGIRARIDKYSGIKN